MEQNGNLKWTDPFVYLIEGVPRRPGTPEVPQTYNNTALVLWKPADSKSPCSYTLERKTEGE